MPPSSASVEKNRALCTVHTAGPPPPLCQTQSVGPPTVIGHADEDGAGVLSAGTPLATARGRGGLWINGLSRRLRGGGEGGGGGTTLVARGQGSRCCGRPPAGALSSLSRASWERGRGPRSASGTPAATAGVPLALCPAVSPATTAGRPSSRGARQNARERRAAAAGENQNSLERGPGPGVGQAGARVALAPLH